MYFKRNSLLSVSTSFFHRKISIYNPEKIHLRAFAFHFISVLSNLERRSIYKHTNFCCLYIISGNNIFLLQIRVFRRADNQQTSNCKRNFVLVFLVWKKVEKRRKIKPRLLRLSKKRRVDTIQK